MELAKKNQDKEKERESSRRNTITTTLIFSEESDWGWGLRRRGEGRRNLHILKVWREMLVTLTQVKIPDSQASFLTKAFMIEFQSQLFSGSFSSSNRFCISLCYHFLTLIPRAYYRVMGFQPALLKELPGLLKGPIIPLFPSPPPPRPIEQLWASWVYTLTFLINV